LAARFKNIKGTFDILPTPSESDGTAIAPTAVWREVEDVIHRQMRLYDVREIRTPILEPTELIARGVGQLTDIVSKELFSFEKGKTSYVLRPEVTAPVMRAYLQHRLDQQGTVQRLYYIGPCFRAERPQKGRYRQFHQFGCEYIGTPDPRADAEVILSMTGIYRELGIVGTRLRINTLGDEASRPRYAAALREYFRDFEADLSETSRDRLAGNPLRILDTKNPKERDLLEEAPRIAEFIDDESLEHFEAVKMYLGEQGVEYEEDPFLVRGLDYYTRTAFELESPDLGAQSALAGGGRYDLLAEEIGSAGRVPAVGFAAGLERLFLALAMTRGADSVPRPPDAFLISLGSVASSVILSIAERLRHAGLAVTYEDPERSMKAQLRAANRSGSRISVILGDDEIAAGMATLKDMETGVQESVPFDDLSRRVSELVKKN
jgi:histidyl-tRNA synthetase